MFQVAAACCLLLQEDDGRIVRVRSAASPLNAHATFDVWAFGATSCATLHRCGLVCRCWDYHLPHSGLSPPDQAWCSISSAIPKA